MMSLPQSSSEREPLAAVLARTGISRVRASRPAARDRLVAMLFLTGLLHAILLLGVTFTAGGHHRTDDTPGLDVLLVNEALPEARQNEHAAYLAQRTQLGAGNSQREGPVRSPNSGPQPGPRRLGKAPAPQTDVATDPRNSAPPPQEALLSTSGKTPDIRYFTQAVAPKRRRQTPRGPPKVHRMRVEATVSNCCCAGRPVRPTGSRLIPALRRWPRIWPAGSAKWSASGL